VGFAFQKNIEAALKRMKKVMIFVAGYLPGYKSGGPVRSVSNMVKAMGNVYDFYIICADRDIGDTKKYSNINIEAWNFVDGAKVFYVRSGFNGWLQILKILFSSKGFHKISFNSFFSIKFSFFPFIISRFLHDAETIIVASRGEFSEGALSLKSTKKKFFIYFIKLFGFYRNIVWHASTDIEKMDIVKIFGKYANVKIAENIPTIPDFVQLYTRDVADSFRVIWISRICRMKNLLGALKIMAMTENKYNFDIYGPVEDEGYWRECRDFIDKNMPDNICVRYKGLLNRNAVADCFGKYDAFLFPTFGENYGHVIAEALLSGIPVLLSDRTPWLRLGIDGVGQVFSLSEASRFSETLDEWAAMDIYEYEKKKTHVIEWSKNNVGKGVLKQNLELFS